MTALKAGQESSHTIADAAETGSTFFGGWPAKIYKNVQRAPSSHLLGIVFAEMFHECTKYWV